MRVLSWLLSAAFLGINIHALLALARIVAGRAKTAIQRRRLASRCALSALGLVVLSVAMGGASIAAATSRTGVDPSARATQLAMGLSEAVNCLGFAVLGSVLPLVAALVCSLLASRAARRA
jgi:hypothetical protein